MNPDLSPRDVYVLYNAREKAVDDVVSALRSRGISLFYDRSDAPEGVDFRAAQNEFFNYARVVLILLGDLGWGEIQRDVGERAVARRKTTVPVLIGAPADTVNSEVEGLLNRSLWIDARALDDRAYDRIAVAIRQALADAPVDPPPSNGSSYDEILRTLVDGSDFERSSLLDRIVRDGVTNPEALANRLRDQIREEFSPDQEKRFATAVRDPKRLASTRSWMLSTLIWVEPSSTLSSGLILEHTDANLEPDRAVRFWTLAGIVQRRLPYVADAISQTQDDPAPEVAGLAAIARNPAHDQTIYAFRSALGSDQFETVWHVLRILRIVPVPALADAIVEQLTRSAEGKPLAYDALFALASPPMATSAAPIILDTLGLPEFVRIVIREARSATAIAAGAFGRILSVFDRPSVISLLEDVAQDPDGRAIAREMIDHLSTIIDDDEPPLLGQMSERIDISKDDIGIRRDVRTLASVMLASDVEPPLAIGLFGEWGSGKSFYIKSLEAAAADIAGHAASSEASPYCSRIVQIHFNAWHYVDTSLWASLVSHMLDGLSAHLTPHQNPTEQRAALARDLASAKAEIGLAKAEQDLAKRQLELTSRELQEKIDERERREIKLSDMRAGDLLAILSGDDTLNKTLRGALRDVGAPAALESVEELNRVVEESYSTTGRMIAFLVSLSKGPNIWIGLIGILLFFLLPPLVTLCIERFMSAYGGELSAVIAKVTVVAGAVTAMLRFATSKAGAALDALSVAKRKVDAQLATHRFQESPREKILRDEVNAAKASEKAAAERVAAATARTHDIENRVAAMEDSQSLGYFIAERSKSEDYRRHLGLISMIRKDFDGLVARLRTSRSDPKGIDRIVLYIDDVDRCPPQMVVDILQAVHLLLAYELFIVVVSVDPRWLLRSLENQMTQLYAGAASVLDGVAASPHDYLEKIFQIPFSVRPMGQQGYARLITRLLPSSGGQVPPPQFADDPKGAQSEPVAIDTDISDAGEARSDAPEIALSIATQFDDGGDAAAATDIETLAARLEISEAETEFAKQLFMLLPTPRSAKRFANIYRLLKASVSRVDLRRFEGETGVPGEFQLPMLLLAIVVGRSKLAGRLFPALLAQARGANPQWWSAGWEAIRPVGDRVEKQAAQEAFLKNQLDPIVSSQLFPHRHELVSAWLPQVARYSFTTAQMFLESR